LTSAKNGAEDSHVSESDLESDMFLKDAPIFRSTYSESETKKMIESNPSWYHYFKFENVETPSGRTSINFQMKMAQKIPLDLTGKSVLDIGTADGFYSFLCESRGAKKVVAVDFLEFDGFKIAKKILQSNVEHRIMYVNDIDKMPETFDIIIFFGVYYHLANPVLALQKIFSKANDTVFVAGHIVDNPEPIMCYYDPYEIHPQDSSNWWVASPSCLVQIGKRIGFRYAEVCDIIDIGYSYEKEGLDKGIRKLGKQGLFKFSK